MELTLQIWCSISPNWVLIRIVLYYAPVWYVAALPSIHTANVVIFDRIIIATVLVFYFLIGIEIVRLRDEFKLTSEDHIQLTSHNSGARPFGNPGGSFTTTIEANPKPNSPQVLENHVAGESSIEQAIAPRPIPSNQLPLKYKMTKQRNVSFKQYILMPSLFFLALLTTWLTPTINRVSAFIHPEYESYSLLLAVSALGSLRGFWNGVIFVTIGMKGWKRRALERRAYNRQVSISVMN